MRLPPDRFAHLRHGVPGEDWVADPRERRLRVIAQLIDKPLTLLLVAAAFALAARGPGWAVPGMEPSGWFVLGLWFGFSAVARLLVVLGLTRFRRWAGIAGPE